MGCNCDNIDSKVDSELIMVSKYKYKKITFKTMFCKLSNAITDAIVY